MNLEKSLRKGKVWENLANEKWASCFVKGKRQDSKQLSGENKAHTRTVHTRHCSTSRYIFHLVRQSSLRNSELEDRGSCSNQTGAAFQISSVANRCQNTQKVRTAGPLNHMQDGRPFREKLGNSRIHSFVFRKTFRIEFFFLSANQNSKSNTNACGSFMARGKLVEALRYKPQGRGFDSQSVIGIFHWHNTSCRTMALGLTQPLTEISTSNISWV
jgi:hypothetical protein